MDVLLGRDLLTLVGLAAVPGFLAIVAVLPLQESPKWLLITRGDKEAALESLTFYRGGTTEENMQIVNEMLMEAEQTARIDIPVCAAVREVLRQPHLRRAMVIGVLSLQV